MFIWVAIDASDRLKGLRDRVKQIEGTVHFEQSDLTLPMHISLMISKEIPDDIFDAVVQDIHQILDDYEPFPIQVKGMELHESISWLAMEPNDRLENLHAQLCNLFSNKYGIQLHKFDTEFRYHSTLFLDSDAAKVKEAFLKIKDAPLPERLLANRFLIGGSETGKIGTYRVFESFAMGMKSI